jgi:hypothetical protein
MSRTTQKTILALLDLLKIADTAWVMG